MTTPPFLDSCPRRAEGFCLNKDTKIVGYFPLTLSNSSPKERKYNRNILIYMTLQVIQNGTWFAKAFRESLWLKY